MARYRGSVLKLVRSAGVHLSGFPKSAKLKKSYGPGQHGQARKKLSEYAIQLNEKQKVRRTYGVQEKQFRRTYQEATRRKGVTGTIMLQLLELRADNILFRSGLVVSRPQARQLIAHGHLLVNGRKMDIASYRVRPGDVLTVREKSQKLFKQLQETNPYGKPVIPEWMEVDEKSFALKISRIPDRVDIDPTINESLIIEYYSR